MCTKYLIHKFQSHHGFPHFPISLSLFKALSAVQIPFNAAEALCYPKLKVTMCEEMNAHDHTKNKKLLQSWKEPCVRKWMLLTRKKQNTSELTRSPNRKKAVKFSDECLPSNIKPIVQWRGTKLILLRKGYT